MAVKIDPSTTAIVERFQSVLYPFPMEKVLEALPTQGWIVPFADSGENEVKLSAAPSKGNVRLVFDMNLRTLGVRGVDNLETLREFSAVSAFVVERWGLASEVSSYFTELRFVGLAKTGAAPKDQSVPERLAEWWAGHERSDRLARVIGGLLPGDELGAFGIRMATKGKDANRPDWVELTVAPSAQSGSAHYTFDLVYRSHDRDRVRDVAARAAEVVVAAVEELER